MLRWVLGFAGKRAIHSAAKSHNGRPPLLDIRLGFRLLRDRRVPLRLKCLALLLGTAAVGVLVAMELPVEALVGGLLNVLGLGLDFLVDGFELLIGPLLFAAVFLPHLAPPELLARIQGEPTATRELPGSALELR